MLTFKSYFKKRGIMGFYLPLVAATLSLIIGLSYFGYSYSRYYQPWINVLRSSKQSVDIVFYASLALLAGSIGFYFFAKRKEA